MRQAQEVRWVCMCSRLELGWRCGRHERRQASAPILGAAASAKTSKRRAWRRRSDAKAQRRFVISCGLKLAGREQAASARAVHNSVCADGMVTVSLDALDVALCSVASAHATLAMPNASRVSRSSAAAA